VPPECQDHRLLGLG